MQKGITLIRLGAILTFVVALVYCVVILHNDKLAKAGIATLRFNFSNIHLPNNPLLMPRSVIPGRDLLQPLQSDAKSAANVVSTVISPAISKAQSAASAAAAISINAVEEMIPRNCSLGTKQFCVGFDNRTECNNLPLNISNIVPEAVANFVGDQVQALQPLPGILAKVTVANIQDCLILGLVLIVLVIAISCFANYLLRPSICTGMVIISMAGLICCVPFVIPAFILIVVESKIENLSSSIEVQKGDVGRYYLGVLCCGIVMTLLATLSPILVRRGSNGGSEKGR